MKSQPQYPVKILSRFKSVSEELYNGISDSYFVNLHRSQSLKSIQLLQLHQEYYIVMVNVVAAVVIIGSRGKHMQRTYFFGIDALSRRPLAFLAFSSQVQSKATAERTDYPW